MPDLNIMPRVNSQEAVRKLLLGDDAYATTLLVLCTDLYGHLEDDEGRPMAFLHWHPAALKMELEDDFGVAVPGHTLDRLMAGVALMTTDYFFRDVGRFMQLACVLGGNGFSPSEVQVPSAVECAWAITEALLLDPPGDENPEPFSDDVRRFLGEVLREEGFVRAPDVLKIALDSDWSALVSYTFADNPGLFEGINAVQQGKADDVNRSLQTGLLGLAGQLKALPLRNGSADSLLRQIAATLQVTAV